MLWVKVLAKAFIVALLFSLLAGTLIVGKVQAETEVRGIIFSDTTWTKANSPYALTGNILVNSEVTLTIEAGASVSLNSYYIQVDGTLVAKGSSANKIHFDLGSIKFEESSNDWNEQTGTGCIIENAVLNSVTISSNNAIKLDHNSITGDVTVSGSSIISSNTIVGAVITGDSTVVWKNTITGGILTGGLERTSVKYPIISNNVISGGYGFNRWGIQCCGYALIVDNTISDCNYGVYLFTGSQQFGGAIAPNAILERNKIIENTHGIHIELYSTRAYGSITPSISDSTISQNTIGVYFDGDARYLTIKNNNIEDNSNYSIYLSSGQNLNASYNWWGTTDPQSIKQKIFDFDRDFTLGNVTFVPPLTAPNYEAMPNPNAAMPTPTPEQTPAPEQTPTPTPEQTPATSPTPTPTQEPSQEIPFESIIGAAIVVAVIGFGLGLLFYLIKRK